MPPPPSPDRMVVRDGFADQCNGPLVVLRAGRYGREDHILFLGWD
jgi:hypothetical protein